MSSEPVDIDDLVHHLSLQAFRPIRGALYQALGELRDARSALADIREAYDLFRVGDFDSRELAASLQAAL